LLEYPDKAERFAEVGCNEIDTTYEVRSLADRWCKIYEIFSNETQHGGKGAVFCRFVQSA
jgi:hypothetical protein